MRRSLSATTGLQATRLQAASFSNQRLTYLPETGTRRPVATEFYVSSRVRQATDKKEQLQCSTSAFLADVKLWQLKLASSKPEDLVCPALWKEAAAAIAAG
jgi:hypothetical protein